MSEKPKHMLCTEYPGIYALIYLSLCVWSVRECFSVCFQCGNVGRGDAQTKNAVSLIVVFL